MIGIPYFAYMIGSLADLIGFGIDSLRKNHRTVIKNYIF